MFSNVEEKIVAFCKQIRFIHSPGEITLEKIFILLDVWLISGKRAIDVPTISDYSWNRNTTVLLYSHLSDHGEQKLLAHMINRYYNPL